MPTSDFNILFWNTQGTVPGRVLADLVSQHDVALICLAECDIPPSEVAASITGSGRSQFTKAYTQSRRLDVYARSDVRLQARYFDINGRIVIYELDAGPLNCLFAATHLLSMRETDEDDRYTEACIVASTIRETENDLGIDRTILCGDFNMNPFARGIVSANAFHGVSDRRVSMKRTRTFQKRSYPFFYNPMWNLLGDITVGPPGSHFYRNSGHVSYDWNLFDQFLLRPALINHFRGVQVLTDAGGVSLAKKSGRPDKRTSSDHFPVLAQFQVPHVVNH